ncbi:ParB/RepB/Spo0J family partition protein [Candidatus Pantoea multigeneris]|uniref:Chromosome partitioning protein ParB n=1 Tax=Candidatus Pantoea multigeneris TaxID=2608357 RepID=A0ABX0R739_9GAMM|nr:chromosome partitioning protein ParB [Pantoea multigeneris]NIF20599.1 chromosome partitioning protein ParB [Pantoea multigeneris]
MTTLSLVYKDKDATDTNITTRKTYLLGVSELYVEPGYNVREIDQTHVEEFRDAFIAGEHIPPLAVQVTEQGIKIIDGHHRYYGALLAQEAGHEIRLECKDFVGSEADRIAFMVTSSQGRALEPLERAAAYQRMMNQGWEPAEIAKKVKRSVADVDHHLQLLTVGDGLIAMVKTGEVAATTAVAMVREHGAKAEIVAKTQLEKAKASGKKKLTRAAAMPQISAAKARRLVELLANAEVFPHGEGSALELIPEIENEVNQILAEFAQLAGESRPSHEVPEAELEAKLPLLRGDMLAESGLAVLACAVAAFGDKEAYSYAESKYAHTWAADGIENPEFLAIPADTIAKAVSFKKQHSVRESIAAWVANNYQDDPALNEVTERFVTVASEDDMPLEEMLALMDRIDRKSGYNIRELRFAINNQRAQVCIPGIREGE